LEKSRVVKQLQSERNFHIFYQLLASPDYVEKFGLEDMENYEYTNQSEVYEVDGIDDQEDWLVTLECMKTIGFSEDEIY
jgi:myosin heavy subunit